MKKLITSVIVVAAVLSVKPAFALVDGELFGGYNIAGKIDAGTKKEDLKGWNYGARAHFTTGVYVADFGFGMFIQKTPLDYDYLSRSYTITRTSMGPDVFARVTIIPVIKPYVRAGLSMYEYSTVKGGGDSETDKKYFNNYYAGVGVGFQPVFPVVKFMVFGEYLYNKRYKGGDLIGHTINIGVSLGI
jgi:hypothetical protein